MLTVTIQPHHETFIPIDFSVKTHLPLFLATFTAMVPAARAAPGDFDWLNILPSGSVVTTAAQQPDGKMIIAGGFIWPRLNIARFDRNGALDTGFDPQPNNLVNSIVVQPDGKILLGGSFTSFQPNGTGTPVTRNRVARVNADGTLDPGFDPNTDDTVSCVALQQDGKVLIGGVFRTLQPNGAVATIERNLLARVNADGTLDTGFITMIRPGVTPAVHSLVMLPEGKVLVGGHFSWFREIPPNGIPEEYYQANIARLNADGKLDRSFNPSPEGSVISMAVQADGKVLLAGDFTRVTGSGSQQASTPRDRIARLNANGSLDTGFDPKANSLVCSVAVQVDGKVLLGGYFSTLQPNGADAPVTRNYIARLHADGMLDPGFDPNANSGVLGVVLQADGKVLLGGYFSTLQPNGAGAASTRHGFAHLQNDPAAQMLSVPDATRVSWTRGGSAPEISRVTFELSTGDGSTWTALGNGVRVGTSPNWQLTGLALPASGQIRARGVTAGGYTGSSSGLIGQTASFSPFTPDADSDGLLDSWERIYWPFTAGHSAHDDFDHDGYNELLELALGLNPTAANPGGLPPVVNEGGYLMMSLTKQPGVTYEVQSAGTLLPGMPDSFSAASTTMLINDATTLKVRDNFLIGAGPRRFLRLKVTAAP